MNRSIFVIALMMALLVYSGGVQAEELPKHYPESFQRVGGIDEVGRDLIVINDMEFSLGPYTKVYTPRTQFSTLNALKKGLLVGYATAGKRGAKKEITEIWILPKKFKIEDLE